MEEVIIRIDSETLGKDGQDKDGSITITVINKFEHINV